MPHQVWCTLYTCCFSSFLCIYSLYFFQSYHCPPDKEELFKITQSAVVLSLRHSFGAHLLKEFKDTWNNYWVLCKICKWYKNVFTFMSSHCHLGWWGRREREREGGGGGGKEWGREREREWVCECICVCVCVWERERERESSTVLCMNRIIFHWRISKWDVFSAMSPKQHIVKSHGWSASLKVKRNTLFETKRKWSLTYLLVSSSVWTTSVIENFLFSW